MYVDIVLKIESAPQAPPPHLPAFPSQFPPSWTTSTSRPPQFNPPRPLSSTIKMAKRIARVSRSRHVTHEIMSGECEMRTYEEITQGGKGAVAEIRRITPASNLSAPSAVGHKLNSMVGAKNAEIFF